jgi:hypothetical protein
MKLAALFAVVLLTGCSTVVTQRAPFPEAPDSALVSCPDLALVPSGTEKLSEILNVVTSNYAEYHICRAKVDAWIEWHRSQTEISNRNN